MPRKVFRKNAGLRRNLVLNIRALEKIATRIAAPKTSTQISDKNFLPRLKKSFVKNQILKKIVLNSPESENFCFGIPPQNKLS